MAELVPDDWKEAVVAILADAPDYTRIRITKRASQDFQSMLPLAFNLDICRAFERAMENADLAGNQVDGMVPEGTTYEFIFVHEGRDVYGKVCLTTEGNLVVIFSAHIPLKGETV